MVKWPCRGCEAPLTMDEETKHICPRRTYKSSMSGTEFGQCTECLEWIRIDSTHFCRPRRVGRIMDLTKRSWNHRLECWVLDEEPKPKKAEKEPEPNFYWVNGKWMSEEEMYTPEVTPPVYETPPPEKQEFIASSCEIPPDYWKKRAERERKSSYSYGSNWKPTYPWLGVDRKKWPHTWWALFNLYHMDDWYKGKWVSDDYYNDRLQGKYAPEPKTNHYKPYYNRGYDGC